MTFDPGHTCLCWPLGRDNRGPIDTRTCGRDYLNIDRVRENPCQDEYDDNCVAFEAFFNGKYWTVPNPWDQNTVSTISLRADLFPGWKTEFMWMEAEAFCDPVSWNS